MFMTGIDTFQFSPASQAISSAQKPVSATRPSDEDTQRSKGSQEQVGRIQDQVTLSKEAQALSASQSPSHPNGSSQQAPSLLDR